MDDLRRLRRARSFVLGGLVGASAVLAAARRKRPRRRPRGVPGGLGAFEEAPCFEETLERERQEEDAEPAGRTSPRGPAPS